MNEPAPRRTPAPHVEVLEEQETANGWSFVAQIDRGGVVTRHTVLLSWVDHDHWTGGSTTPSSLVRRLVTLLVTAPGVPELPPRFDAAKARRWVPDLDDRLMGMG